MAGISFDRIADRYDASRSLPQRVSDQLADVLAAELTGKGLVLEFGVGTGRIALPLHDRGVDLIGSDLSPLMLAKLTANASGHQPFPLVIGDATRPPVMTRSLGAVLFSHVLHLIADWTTAVDEALGLIREGGAVLVDFGGGTPAPWDEETTAILRRHGVTRVRPGVSRADDVARYLGDRVLVRDLPGVTFSFQRTLAQDLNDWRDQVYAWSWPYSPDQLRAACAEVDAWAGRNWPVDRQVTLERTIQWWAFQPVQPGCPSSATA